MLWGIEETQIISIKKKERKDIQRSNLQLIFVCLTLIRLKTEEPFDNFQKKEKEIK